VHLWSLSLPRHHERVKGLWLPIMPPADVSLFLAFIRLLHIFVSLSLSLSIYKYKFTLFLVQADPYLLFFFHAP